MNPRKVRRTEDYHFYSLMELFEYFSNFLSREETDSAVRESAHGFVLRQFETEEGTRLQFVKRCEFAMDLLAQLKEVGVYPGFKKSNRERGGSRSPFERFISAFRGQKYVQVEKPSAWMGGQCSEIE